MKYLVSLLLALFLATTAGAVNLEVIENKYGYNDGWADYAPNTPDSIQFELKWQVTELLQGDTLPEFDITAHTGAGRNIFAQSVRHISENNSYYLNTEKFFFGPGHYEIVWTLDFHNAIRESMEEDNILRIGFTIEDTANAVNPAVGGGNGFKLYMPYPVPSNGSFNISYELPSSDNVTICVADINGNILDTIYAGRANAGKNTLIWKTERVPSGSYFIILTSSMGRKIQRVVYIL